MKDWIDIFNNRELALITWIVIIVLFVLVSKKARPSTFHLIKSFFKGRIIGVQLVTWCYVGFIIWMFCWLNLWNMSMLKDTLIWALFTTFLMNIKFFTSKKQHYLKDTFLDVFKLIVVFEFIVNMYAFNYFIELMILFLLAVIVGMIAFAEAKKEYQIVANFLNFVLAIWGVFVIYHSLKQIWNNFNSIEWSQTTLDFLMPMWLTILFIPFMFGLKRYTEWEKNQIRNKYSKSRK